MKTIIIAAAPTNTSRFQPVYAKFPISDSVLLDCMGSQSVTDKILAAGCLMLGMDEDTPHVAGLYYKLPERPNRSFEQFLDDLEMRQRRARREVLEEVRPQYATRNPLDIFQAIMKL